MRALAVSIALLFFAGCTGDQPIPSSSVVPTTGSTKPSLDVSAELPTWNLGQSWTYQVEVPGKPTRTFKMIVAEDRREDRLWVVATNDREQAVHHAIYSTNPMLGRIGKDTLAPFQSGAPVKMFQFPLTDGKSWQALFFDETMAFDVEYAGDIDASAINSARNLPKRVDGFRITATGPSGAEVRYDYVEAVEWFTSFEIVDKNGDREIKLTLSDFESGYKGSYYFYRGAKDSESLMQAIKHEGAPSTVTYDANIPDGFKDFVGVGILYVGKSSIPGPSVTFTLRDPGGATKWEQTVSGAREVHVLKDVPGTAGKWSVATTQQGTFDAELRVFGISKFAEGTL